MFTPLWRCSTAVGSARPTPSAAVRSKPRVGPREALIEYVADRPGHDYRYRLDPTKIGSELGWAPRESFKSGLARTVKWYLDNRSWWERIRSGIYRGERVGLAS